MAPGRWNGLRYSPAGIRHSLFAARFRRYNQRIIGRRSSMDARTSRYHEVYARWQRDPEGFWAEAGQEIDWYEKPKQVFDPAAGVYGRWFVDGVCNTCFNAVDRHVLAGRGEQAAIIYDSPLARSKRVISYARLQTETQVLA